MKTFQSAIIWLLLSMMIAGCTSPDSAEIIEFSGRTMGTWYSVKVADLPGSISRQQVADTIQSELDNVNQKMSTYRDDSELSKFNHAPVGAPFEVSKDTYQVISRALEIWRLSHGAFDITVGPLVNLWGFGPSEKTQTLPSKSDMVAAWERVGSDSLMLHSNVYQVEKVKDVYLDLSAIAKGYGVDKVSLALQDLGVHRFLVEVGGEVRAGADKSDGNPWRVALEEPVSDQRKVHSVVPLTNVAMATSGDYRNFFEVKGKRYSHTIDPRSGMPVEHNLVSATVILDNCADADAWATAFMVLGPDEGMAMAEAYKIPLYMIIKVESGFESRYSQSFAMYLPKDSR